MALLTRGFAGERGSELALADDHGEMTWGELDVAVNRTIHALREAGLGAGDTIAIVAGNRNEWFVLSLACAQAGIVHVPVNWHLVAPEMAYIFGDSGSRAVFAGHRFDDVVHAALADDRSNGVEMEAIVVANEGIDRAALGETLRRYCREQLAGYKVPRSIDFADDLPRTGTGKVQKRKLRDQYWRDRDRAI